MNRFSPNNFDKPVLRRDFMRYLGATAFALPTVGGLISLQGCGNKENKSGETSEATDSSAAGAPGAERKLGRIHNSGGSGGQACHLRKTDGDLLGRLSEND